MRHIDADRLLNEVDFCRETTADFAELIRRQPTLIPDERDLSKKPISNPEPRWAMGDAYHDWLCPNCHAFLAYEPAGLDIRGRCRNCGQSLTSLSRDEVWG